MAYKKSLRERLSDEELAKRKWRSNKKKYNGDETFEGTQYKGGRKAGRKNLVKLDSGNLLNQHGIEFTQADKKRLESLVNSANRKRMNMLEYEGSLPRFVGGRPTGELVKNRQAMGGESDFILARKTKSLQRFKTREQYESYIKNLERVMSPTYIDDRTRLYKQNHITALYHAFGDDAKDVAMKIQMMKPAEYRELLASDEDLEISFIYDPSDRSAKLNRIRAAMKMKLKEEEYQEVE